jgi:RNA polymerase sigma factor (sigma-70 family)
VGQANQGGGSGEGLAPPAQPPPDEVFDRFYRATYPRLVAFGYGCRANWADAEDAAAEAMIVVLQRWSTIGAGKHEAYARVALVRAIVRIGRPRAGFQTYPAPVHELPIPPDDGNEMTVLEDSEWINQLLNRLAPARRTVVEGFLAGKTYREMADEQRKSETTIRKNQQLGLRSLRRLLSRNQGLPRGSGPAMTTREGNR